MAKTIKELAVENAHKKFPLNKAEDEYGWHDIWDVCHDEYINGASFVIRQIENIIDKNEDGCITLEEIQLRISELKR